MVLFTEFEGEEVELVIYVETLVTGPELLIRTIVYINDVFDLHLITMALKSEARHADKILVCRHDWHTVSVSVTEVSLGEGNNDRLVVFSRNVVEVAVLLHVKLFRLNHCMAPVHVVLVVDVLSFSLLSVHNEDKTRMILRIAQCKGVKNVV